MQDSDVMQDHKVCLRCGRKLKNPEARKIGYGSVCYRKIQHCKKSVLFTVKKK